VPTVINAKTVKICLETLRITVLQSFLQYLAVVVSRQVFQLYNDYFGSCHVTV